METLRRQAALAVTAQFAACVVICTPARFVGATSVPEALAPVATGLLVAGVALAVWTISHNRPGNFGVRPEVKSGTHLVTTGPYRWIRHPMYLTLLLSMAGVTLLNPHAPGHWALGVLVVVLLAKIRIEERFLVERFPEYAAYASHTRRLIPFLF